jgi:hypothetical protein
MQMVIASLLDSSDCCTKKFSRGVRRVKNVEAASFSRAYAAVAGSRPVVACKSGM